MKRQVGCTLLVAFCAALAAPARADSDALIRWFVHATAYETNVTATKLSEPDFLPGKSQRSMACHYVEGRPVMGTWQLMKYDRVHHIGLASATTDACAVAVFRASKPSVSVSDADLSHYSTGRGLHVGSSYQAVLATYGGTPMRGSHFVAEYAASVPGETFTKPHKKIALPQDIKIVVDHGYVSAITVFIELGGEV